MQRLIAVLLFCVFLGSLCQTASAETGGVLLAQSSGANASALVQDQHTFVRREGGYLAWYKLLLVSVVLFVWVAACEWVNKDVQRTTRVTKLSAETWNPIVVFPFLFGFIAVFAVPIFWIGFPVYLLTAVVPFFIYVSTRNKRVEKGDTAFTTDHIRRKRAGIEGSAAKIEIAQDQGPKLEFDAAGDDDMQKKTNLMHARHSAGFVTLKGVLFETFVRRSPQLALNFTRDAVSIRCEVDGVWQDLPTLDRMNGDAMLVALKFLSGLNPQDRRNRQRGSFKSVLNKEKLSVQVTSQGVATGEQVIAKITSSRTKELEPGELGMTDKVFADLKSALNHPGLVLISTPPGHGLTTSWDAALNMSDRLTRDAIALVDQEEDETDVENIELQRFDANTPGALVELLRATDLRQPDLLVVPRIVDATALDMLVGQVEKDRTVVSRMRAKSATEVLLSLLGMSGQRRKCLSAISAILCQRLLRRLCPQCKTPVPTNPQQIQKLGGNPQQQYTLYMPYQPPPQPLLDDKGNPIIPPVCNHCRGIGYVDRIGAFELLKVDDALEKAVIKSPKADEVQLAAQRTGHLTTLQAGYQHVLNGVTAFPEIQRVFKS